MVEEKVFPVIEHQRQLDRLLEISKRRGERLNELWRDYEADRQRIEAEYQREFSHIVSGTEDESKTGLPKTLLGLPVVITDDLPEGEIKLGPFTFDGMDTEKIDPPPDSSDNEPNEGDRLMNFFKGESTW